jgi:acetyltransferase-like isoleucine patch superfamily enzyme
MLGQLPSYVFHYFFSLLYSTATLRAKAAYTPYPMVRYLLLSRSGVKIGREVRINVGTVVSGSSRRPICLTLGDRVAIGPNTVFVTSSTPNDSVLYGHPDVQRMIKKFGPIVVEEDAWIGAAVTVLPGVTIGRGAIVGAGAVVIRDVAPWTVAVGVPARMTRALAGYPAGPDSKP